MVKIFVLSCIILSLTNFRKVELKKERIIGGTAARAGQFPFIAAIDITKPNGKYFCSGTLINQDYVLTAGQCVDGASLLTIYLGSNDLRGDENQLILATDMHFLHPEYNFNTLENDVALIKFRSPITFTDYIRPIKFLSTTQLPDYATVTTMGWGQTSDDTSGPLDDLNYVYLTTFTNDECRETFGAQITDSMVCAGGNFNEGTCLGDAGSPLVQYGGSNFPYHVGISSFVSSLGCERTDPSGFTRTSYHVQWIENITLSNQVN